MSSYRPRYRDPSPKHKVPFDVKRLQCYFWTHDQCNWGDKCRYAHHYTGKVADKPIMKSNGKRKHPTHHGSTDPKEGLSVAGRNASSHQPVYRRWQGRRRASPTRSDIPPEPDRGAAADATFERRLRSGIAAEGGTYEILNSPGDATRWSRRQRSCSPLGREYHGDYYGDGRGNRSRSSLYPSPTKKANTPSLGQATTADPSLKRESTPTARSALENLTSKTKNTPKETMGLLPFRERDPNSGFVSTSSHVTMSLETYEEMKKSLGEAKSELQSRAQRCEALENVITLQERTIGDAGVLLQGSSEVLEGEGQLAMDLSQKMQRGERIGADTITETWLAATELLRQADHHAHEIERWHGMTMERAGIMQKWYMITRGPDTRAIGEVQQESDPATASPARAEQTKLAERAPEEEQHYAGASPSNTAMDNTNAGGG